MERNFTSISPTARFLVQLKAQTRIPFAKEMAAVFDRPAYTHEFEETIKDKAALLRALIHFENRYRSIDKLLKKIASENILELSSGFSGRGLNLCRTENIHFIDTDLPDIILQKQQVIEMLNGANSNRLVGKLDLLPLNALDEKEFSSICGRFNNNPVTIINEGLLVYLNTGEKVKICSIIRKVLEQHKGYWITGDVYIKKNASVKNSYIGEKATQFRKEQGIDENRFDSFAQAEEFFNANGFHILHRAALDITSLSCLENEKENKTAIINKLRHSGHNRETWCLELTT